jgi:hypothetical protein
MAVTITPYNHTLKKLRNKEITYTTLKVMLLNQAAVTGFNAANTTLADVLAGAQDEVSGNGWTAGGETIANVAVTTVTTNDAKLDGDDISKTATGGAIGPAYGAVIYDDTDADDAPLALINFGQAEEAGESTDFKIIWPAGGIITDTYT